MKLNKVVHVFLLASCMTGSNWTIGRPPHISVEAERHAVSTVEAHAGERTVDAVQVLTDRVHGVPSSFGVRPPFIPSGAVVVKTGVASVVTLKLALSRRAGSIVVWVP